MKTGLRWLGGYLWARRGRLVLLAVCCGIFAVVLTLYGEKGEPVLYAGALCAVVLAGAGALGAAREYALCRQLTRLREELAAGLGELPAPRTPAEAEYAALCAALESGRVDAARAADAARQDMREYYTLWAHQIKTPLAALRLLTRGDPGRAAMEAELVRVEQYVEMALCYLQASSGQDLVLRTCPLDPVIRASVRRFAPLFIQKKLALVYEGTELSALTDEKWLAFMLEQLLSNALKYTPQGSITLRVLPGPVLRVEDTGPGIPPADLPHIFERGYTGCRGRADKRATGVGLYLCRRLADQLGHRISAENRPGGGATFALDMTPTTVQTE